MFDDDGMTVSASSIPAPLPASDGSRRVRLQGVQVHNLQGLSLEFPLDRLVALTGVSGSGKSSLAYQTIYAEAQHRYLESLSLSARQWLATLERPEAEFIGPLPPVLIAEQGWADRDWPTGATVASVTGIRSLLIKLMLRWGEQLCPACGTVIATANADAVLDACHQLPDGCRVLVAFPVLPEENTTKRMSTLASQGFSRLLSGEAICQLATNGTGGPAAVGSPALPIWVIVDRLVAGQSTPERWLDSIETAADAGLGAVTIFAADALEEWSPLEWTIDGRPFRYRAFHEKPQCGRCQITIPVVTPEQLVGTSQKLTPSAQFIRLASQTLSAWELLSVERFHSGLLDWASQQSAQDARAMRLITGQLEQSLAFLCHAGLGYLPLGRLSNQLSTGEQRRIMLAKVLGIPLVETLIIVDEPSAGLHPLDRSVIADCLREAVDKGNSVLAIDHAGEVLNAADYLVELGPGAGASGGQVVFSGPIEDVSESTCLAASVITQAARPLQCKETVRSARGSVLMNGWPAILPAWGPISVPLGVLGVVTGVSGSGKTRLLLEGLVPEARSALLGTREALASIATIEAAAPVTDIQLIDTSPISRSPRSTIATYLQVFDDIRQVFADTADAQAKGLSPGYFSYNSSGGGRCPECAGLGELKSQLSYLPDLRLVCPGCEGTRYRDDALAIRYRAHSIADVLSLTIGEAIPFFRAQPKIQKRLLLTKEIGLDYLTLGQSCQTISGGEAQRLKLATRLANGVSQRTLFVCDEPTLGLHDADVTKVIACLEQLLDVGHSVVVADVHTAILEAADWVLDLGAKPLDIARSQPTFGSLKDVLQVPRSALFQWQAGNLNTC
jgi:excinuclease ABC subunit A